MPNALAHEKSPYLLQHADNPVAWLPWGDVAFAKARAEQKPIFLSIGYATCHWCHVMAHESFENRDVAAVLNESFVAIKVDREERPDVDKVYMPYVQAMTGHGGWPLSAWLTPELKPFFGGTYFPPEDSHGRPGFTSLLKAIANGWATEREKLVGEGERVIGTLREHFEARKDDGAAIPQEFGDNAAAAFGKCFEHFYESFDPEHAGFGGAPKFPRASNLNFLFRAAVLQGVTSDTGAEAIKMATATCRAMAQGGIHDHVGGGFHRYSVDGSWFVPHFEKMLYDQAQIAVNMLEANQATGDERYAWMARDVFAYVLRDLAHPAGGFYSAEDADSATGGAEAQSADPEHRLEADATQKPKYAEGAFYVWTHAEIAAALGEDAPMFCAHFGVSENGNVPAQLDPHEEFGGKNILAQRQTLAATAHAYGLSVEEASERILGALEKLRAVRNRRPRPLLDDKIITAWNGLMISALAKGHQVLERALPVPGESAERSAPRSGGVTAAVYEQSAAGTQPLHDQLSRGSVSGENESDEREQYLDAALRAAQFLERELYDAERGVLYRSWRLGRGAVEAFAEDYAFLIQGLLDLYEAGFDVHWLQWACRLQETMNARFWDKDRGGFFNSQADDPAIVLRLKEDYDGAEPAASSVAAMNLFRLGAVLDREIAAVESYHSRGRSCIGAFQAQLAQTPQALPQLLCAVELALSAPRHVVLAGDKSAEDFRALASVLAERLATR